MEESTNFQEETRDSELLASENSEFATLEMILPLNGGSSGGGGFSGSWDVELPSDWDKPTTGTTDNKITQVDNRVRTLRTSTDNSFKNVKARFEMVEYNIGQILSKNATQDSQISTLNTQLTNAANAITAQTTTLNSWWQYNGSGYDYYINDPLPTKFFRHIIRALAYDVKDVTAAVKDGFNKQWNYVASGYDYDVNDGQAAKLLRHNFRALAGDVKNTTSAIDSFKSIFNYEDAPQSYEYYAGDGLFSKLLRGQTRASIFYARNNLFDYSGDGYEYHAGDSTITKFFRHNFRAVGNDVKTVNSSIENLKNLFNYVDAPQSFEYFEEDSVYAKLLRGQTRGSLYFLRNNLFDYSGDGYEYHAGDSTITKFFRHNFRALGNDINSLSNTLVSKTNDIISQQKTSTNTTKLSIENLDKTITNFSDLTNLNILAQTTSINKLNDIWKTTDASGIVLASDGDAVKLFKTLFKDLSNHLTDRFANLIDSIAVLFEAYFGANPDGGTGYFSKLLEDQIYRLRYTIIEEFSGINEWLSIQSDWLESISDKTSLGNGLLDTIAGWLKLIYEKPSGEITIPPNINIPFDFDRLEDILEKLSFGNIVNEAGTNIWDFLKELISSLTDLLGQILDLLTGLLDDILGLIIPKNLDFMYSAFDSIGDKFQVKFDFIFGGVDAIKNIFGTSQAVFEDIDFSIGFIDGVSSVKLPMSKINDFAVYLRPILTGFLVLDFLISMYKWFHERGQVVE